MIKPKPEIIITNRFKQDCQNYTIHNQVPNHIFQKRFFMKIFFSI